MKPEVEQIDGFIDNERFGSQRTEGRLLSLSTWRDEKAVIRWRTLAAHHAVQEKGREEILEDYHLRVGEIVTDTHIPDGQVLHEQHFEETEVGISKVVTICELAPEGKTPSSSNLPKDLDLPATGEEGVIDQEVFESIYNPGKMLLLTSWEDHDAASAWQPKLIEGHVLRHRQVRIIRDYGMLDRREAPQFYPSVKRMLT